MERLLPHLPLRSLRRSDAASTAAAAVAAVSTTSSTTAAAAAGVGDTLETGTGVGRGLRCCVWRCRPAVPPLGGNRRRRVANHAGVGSCGIYFSVCQLHGRFDSLAPWYFISSVQLAAGRLLQLLYWHCLLIRRRRLQLGRVQPQLPHMPVRGDRRRRTARAAFEHRVPAAASAAARAAAAVVVLVGAVDVGCNIRAILRRSMQRHWRPVSPVGLVVNMGRLAQVGDGGREHCSTGGCQLFGVLVRLQPAHRSPGAVSQLVRHVLFFRRRRRLHRNCGLDQLADLPLRGNWCCHAPRATDTACAARAAGVAAVASVSTTGILRMGAGRHARPDVHEHMRPARRHLLLGRSLADYSAVDVVHNYGSERVLRHSAGLQQQLLCGPRAERRRRSRRVRLRERSGRLHHFRRWMALLPVQRLAAATATAVAAAAAAESTLPTAALAATTRSPGHIRRLCCIPGAVRLVRNLRALAAAANSTTQRGSTPLLIRKRRPSRNSSSQPPSIRSAVTCNGTNRGRSAPPFSA